MKKKKKPLPTIWEVTDELWKRMAPLILEMVAIVTDQIACRARLREMAAA